MGRGRGREGAMGVMVCCGTRGWLGEGRRGSCGWMLGEAVGGLEEEEGGGEGEEGLSAVDLASLDRQQLDDLLSSSPRTLYEIHGHIRKV